MPPSVDAPVTLMTSKPVPAASPPTSMLVMLAGPSVRLPTMFSVPGEKPAATVPAATLRLPVSVPVPSSVPPFSAKPGPPTVMFADVPAPVPRWVNPAVWVKPPDAVSVTPLLSVSVPLLVNALLIAVLPVMLRVPVLFSVPAPPKLPPAICRLPLKLVAPAKLKLPPEKRKVAPAAGL